MEKNEQLYNVRMRASAQNEHVSGCERIVDETQLNAVCSQLLTRALHHAKGKPDFVNIKLEALNPDIIGELQALPVFAEVCDSPEQADAMVRILLERDHIARADAILAMLRGVKNMRGAILLNVDTFERLEPDPERGIRVSVLDAYTVSLEACGTKNHFAEALVLATKVAHAPGILGELCISDDPDYTTGYYASKTQGYRRLFHIKPMHVPYGGRIFLFRGTPQQAQECIAYLEKQPIRVHLPHPVPSANDARPYARYEKVLEQLHEAHVFRTMRCMESAPSSAVVIEKRRCLQFSSNDYLGMAADAKLKAAAIEALEQFGTGSSGARLTTGTTPYHLQLEQRGAVFAQTSDAVLFNSGYDANSGALSALTDEHDVIFSDELNHASLIEGCRLSRARTIVYRHNDMADLEAKIRTVAPCRGWIVSDAVFSMDGDVLPLPTFLDIAARYNLYTYVDQAHSYGVMGAHGRGLNEHFNDPRLPDLSLCTLSKAFGSSGALLCGDNVLCDFLRNKARSFIFTTALSASVCAASCAALDELMRSNQRVETLRANIRFFSAALREVGLGEGSDSAVFTLIIGDEAKTMACAEKLREEALYVCGIRYPTVARGAARLRISLSALHTHEDLETLIAALKKVVE